MGAITIVNSLINQDPDRMKISIIYPIIFLGCIIQSCIKNPDITPPEAEITNIYNITDSSASFDVVVTSPSNAQYAEDFFVVLDTVNITLFKLPLHGDHCCYPLILDSIYTVAITGLFPNTHYYARIHYEGLFDIGGPNESKYFLLGEEKEFTTLP